jgi:hypothetical protein
MKALRESGCLRRHAVVSPPTRGHFSGPIPVCQMWSIASVSHKWGTPTERHTSLA